MKRIPFHLILLLIVAWAVFLRVWGLSGWPFWIDEAWIANAVTEQSFGELLRQTDDPVPPMFAVTVRWLGGLVGPPELGLRLLSVACGIANVLLTFAVLRTARVPRSAALAAMCMAASSPLLVIWSRELKHYQVEACFSLVLALAVMHLRWSPKRAGITGAGIALTCAAGPWFGYGFVFPALALLGVAIVLQPAPGRRRASMTWGLAGFAILLVSTLLLYRTAAAGQAAHPELQAFTRPMFIDALSPADWMRAAGRLAKSTFAIFIPFQWINTWEPPFQNVAYAAVAGVCGLLAAIGLWRWAGRGELDFLGWLLGTWLLILAAAIAQRYPFAQPRMTMFCAVALIPAMAVGLVRLGQALSVAVARRGAPGIVVAILVALLPATWMLNLPLRNQYLIHHDFPAVLEDLRARSKPGEPVLVTIMAGPNVHFYCRAQCDDYTFMPYVAGCLADHEFDYEAQARSLVAPRPTRLWIVGLQRPDFPQTRSTYETLQQSGYRISIVAEHGLEQGYSIATLRRGDRGY